LARLTRLLLPGALLLAGYYAVFGGEHSVMDVRRARAERVAEDAEVARLRRENDSLARARRLARERIPRRSSGWRASGSG
jgi:cell division protein FtsB